MHSAGKKTIRLLLLLYILFSTAGKLMSQTIEQPIVSVLNGALGQIAHDSVATVTDAKWWDTGGEKLKLNLTGKYRIKNIITLKLNEDTAAYLKPKFNVSVKFKLFITRSDGAIDSSLTPYLTIGYDTLTGSTYNSQAVFTFYNAYTVTAKIISVDSSYTPSGGTNPPVTPFVKLENEMQIEREYLYTCDIATTMSLSVDTTTLAAKGEVIASWPTARGATEYDLEWTYLDNEALSDAELYKTSGSYDYKKIFTDNATQVTLTGLSYSIPMLYDNEGTLFIRFRPVQNKPGGQRWEGVWSSENTSGAGVGTYANFKGHEAALNWQATTSFAEDGKRKSVVQYFDGSLRSRQTVTKDNTTGTTVVAETMYDFQGRPVIQVLPAPTLSSIIGYAKNFNRAISGPYEKNLYDTLFNPADYCQASAPQMKTDSGAAKYYSSSNTEAAIGFNKYIPDAGGYAFIETRYAQDNTGKVQSQSGVGSNYVIGSGHETKYFYGNPDQKELDGLFGTEVGYASHYFKNMVRDANGQYSVAYIDMHGRTVATALAGEQPTYMDTLASKLKRTITEKISDSTNNIVNDLVLESSRSLLVSDSGAYAFSYTLSPDSIRLQTCSSSNICYDCLYNLEITITDECNNCHLPSHQPYVVVDSNFTFAGIDTVCNTITGFNKSFTVGLPEGNYTVTKKLSISRFAFQYYRDSVFMKKNTCKTFKDFYKQVSDTIRSQMDCTQTSCDSCAARTGSLASFRIYYLNSTGILLSDSAQYRDDIAQAYTQAIEECAYICNNAGENTFIRKAMLLDMTVPIGQYANPDSAFVSTRLYNIFDADHLIWNSPLVIYHDDYGKPDSIINSLGKLVPPNDPTISQQEYMSNFKDCWANDLLPFHPEYDKLVEYEKHNASNIWDQKFGSVDTYADADTKGYLNPVGLTGTHVPSHFNYVSGNLDPLAKSDSLLAGVMQDTVYSYRTEGGNVLSMWGIASVTGKCPNNSSCGLNYINSTINNCINPSVFCTGELDMAWRTFRQIYLTKKRFMMMHQINIDHPLVHLNIPLYKHEHFAESDTAIDNYAASIAGQGGSTVLAGGNSQLAGFYQSNCEAYAGYWWTNLAPCNLTSADSTKLLPRMIQICVGGSNATHAFGSSSTAPGSSLTYTSFEALIKHYIDSMHGINPTQYNYNIACNADLIYAPRPYDNQQALSEVPIFTKPDSCQCSVINTFYNQYTQYGSSDASFSAYLLRVTGTVISDSSLVKLRNLCAGTDTCKFLVSPISLPPALQCGITDVCVTCAQVHNAYDSFRVVFPGVIPAYNADDSVQALKNRAFANYMNHRLGFSKLAVDYLEFMDKCTIGYTDTTARCDSLNAILTYYQQNLLNPHTPRYDIGGCDTSLIQVNITDGPHHSPGVSLADWMDNGILRAPWNDSTIHASSPNYSFEDTICTNHYFSFEARIRSPYSAQAEAKYIALGRPMYYSTFYGTELNTIVFDNGTKSVTATFQRGTGVPGFSDSMYLVVQSGENGTYSSEVRHSTGLKHFGDWATLKFQTYNNIVFIYLNGNPVDTVTFSTSADEFNRFASITYGYDFETDWWKIYDNNGHLRYFEDFNGCDKLAKQTMPACATNCQTGFTTYFNAQRGTSYSFSQIDSLYYATCGTHPDPCDATILDCNHLHQAIKDFIISKAGITYDSIGVEHGVWAYEANTAACDFSGVQMKNRFSTGIFEGYPYPAVPDSCARNYTISYQLPVCTGNEFTLSGRVRLMDPAPAGAAHTATLDVNLNFDNSKHLTVHLNAKNPSTNDFTVITENGTTAFSIPDAYGFPAFTQWLNIQVKFKNDSAIVSFDTTGANLFEVGRLYYPGNFTKITKFGFGCTGYPVQVDWAKLYDAAGTLQYVEEFTDNGNFVKVPNVFICAATIDCNHDFTEFFNAALHTSPFLLYDQVRDLYAKTCGIYIQPCGPVTSLLLCGKTEPVFPPVIITDITACDDSTSLAFVKATELYRAYQDSLKNSFEAKYPARCKQAFKTESFTVTHPQSEYHYTLYYYDQAGNLIKTIPPEGVDLTGAFRTTWTDSVAIARKNGTTLTPSHCLKTNYRYNTLNQVVAQRTPDAGLSAFWYDRLGRLAVSQNARQKAASSTESGRQYSYTRYDVLGRITEVGQLVNATSTALSQAISCDVSSFATWFDGAAALSSGVYGNVGQVTRTVYDNKYPSAIGTPELDAKNLRNRVAYTTYTDDYSIANYNSATFYSYDIHGNVDTLLQDYGQSITGIANVMNSNGSRWKRIVYRYDLISGKVNHVAYQPQYINSSGTLMISQDAFYHRYSYDAENRITLVETSADSTVWEKDARYSYYKHGPLARAVIGQQQVQGIDYAYTLQGWLKGVNSTSLTTASDMGNDGNPANSTTKYIARDAYGFNLNYYAGDYAGINGSNTFAGYYAYLSGGNYRPLYNGNISSMAVNIGKLNDPRFYNYKYDQLNRLKEMDSYTGLDTSTNTWSGLTLSAQYKERISYDGNGNILKYLRHGNNTGSIKMDSLTYKYNYSSGRLQNNKLNYVKDSVGTSVYAEDIDEQPSGNYTYDEIGNLTRDSSENIRLSVGGIKWNVYGKIVEINKVDSTVGNPNNRGRIKKISYTYDAAGNRISKRVVKFGTAAVDYTWYVRDASGNTMSVYSYSKDSSSSPLTGGDLIQSELYLYGSSRLGSLTVNRNVEVTKQIADTTYTLSLGLGSALKIPFIRGIKQYELSNHLGNVLVTVSDKKIGVSSNGNTVDYYIADIINANDYYPFGMMQPGRKFSAGSEYRYGFNGKENDHEVSGDGNQYNYGFRIYDPRLGRFKSVDPLRAHYPWNSTYCFAENDVVRAIDLDGCEHKVVIQWIDKKFNDGVLHIAKTSVRINQSENFDGWGQPSKESRSSGSVFALTETYYYMMSEKKLYKGKDLLENSNVNDVNPPPSAQYDYTVNENDAKDKEDMKWIGGSYILHPFKTARIGSRDIGAPDNAQTVTDLGAMIFTLTSAISLPGMARSILRAEGVAVNGVNAGSVVTPYETAVQSSSAAATQAVESVTSGGTLYRIGTKGVSKTGADAQFWSLENPLTNPEIYAKKYGVPLANVKNADFIETAVIKPDGKFITREAPTAPGAAPGAGGGVEVVVEQGGTTGNVVKPIKH